MNPTLAAQVGCFVVYYGGQIALKVYETHASREFRSRQEELQREFNEATMERLRAFQMEHNAAIEEAQQKANERHQTAIKDRDARFAELHAQIEKMQSDYDEKMITLRREYDEKIEKGKREFADKIEQNALAHNQKLTQLNEQQKKENAEAERSLEACKKKHAEEKRLLEEETERFKQERVENLKNLRVKIEKMHDEFRRKIGSLQRKNQNLSIQAAEKIRSHRETENGLSNQMISDNNAGVVNSIILTGNEDYLKKYQEVLGPITDITSAISLTEDCYNNAKYDNSSIAPGAIRAFEQAMKTGIQKWNFKMKEFNQYSITASNVPIEIRQLLKKITGNMTKVIDGFGISEMGIMSMAYDKGDFKTMESKIMLLKGFRDNLVNAESEYPQITMEIAQDHSALTAKMSQMELEDKVGSDLEEPEKV